MSDENEQLFGHAGNEAAQGYEPMPLASPVDVPEPDHMTESELAHAQRPIESDWGREVEREYHDVNTGEVTAPNKTVDARQASWDLSQAREQEAKAIENEAREALAAALDGTEQPQQDQQPTAVDEPQLDGLQPEMTAEQAQQLYQQADKELEAALQNPVVRERIEGEFNAVRQEAAAQAFAAQQQAEAAKAAYVQHANALTGQLSALVLSNFPELQSVAGDPGQLAGAVQLLTRTNPARAQQLQDFVLRASTVAGQLEQGQRQQQEARGRQYQQALEQYTNNEIKQYEQWVAKESPETMRAIRDNLAPIVEKQYGVPFATLKAIHDGKMQMSATEFVRSSAFQKMLHQSIQYNLAKQGVTQARSNPVPQVQRPGVATGAPTQESDYASLERSLRGKSLNIRDAASLLTAHRARR